MLDFLACSEAYEFEQSGTGLPRNRSYTVPMEDKLLFKDIEETTPLKMLSLNITTIHPPKKV